MGNGGRPDYAGGAYIAIRTHDKEKSTPLKPMSSPHRLYDLQDILAKLMNFLPQLSDFVPLKHSFRAQIELHHPIDPGTSYKYT